MRRETRDAEWGEEDRRGQDREIHASRASKYAAWYLLLLLRAKFSMFPVTVNVTVTVDGLSVCVCEWVCVGVCIIILLLQSFATFRLVWFSFYAFISTAAAPFINNSHWFLFYIFAAHFRCLYFFLLLHCCFNLPLLTCPKICWHYLLFGGFAFVSLQYACKQLTECHGEMLKLPFSTI